MEAEGYTYCPWVRLTTKRTARGTSPEIWTWIHGLQTFERPIVTLSIQGCQQGILLQHWHERKLGLKEWSRESRPRRCRSKGVITSAQLFLSVYSGWRQADTQAGLWEAKENTNREVVWLTLFHASLDIRGYVDYNTCSVFPLFLFPFWRVQAVCNHVQTLQLQL